MPQRSQPSKHQRSIALAKARRHLANHWNTIHQHGDPPTRALAVMALDHMSRSISYAIDGRVCTAIFAANPPRQKPPTPFGLALFDVWYRLDDLTLTGFHWGFIDGDWRIVPLTHAAALGLTPAKSPAPMSTGFTITDTDDTDDLDPQIVTVTRIVTATWSAITKTAKTGIIGAGDGNAVLVVHARH